MTRNIGKTPMPSNFGESIRRNIEAEANPEDDGGFFARLGGLEPDPDADGPTAKGLFQNMARNNDENRANCHTPWENRYNKIPDHPGHGLTTDEYLELEKRRQESMKLAANYVRRRYGRKQIVKVWKRRDGFMAGTWAYDCNLCTISSGGTDWATAYNIAVHHARNHHRSQK